MSSLFAERALLESGWARNVRIDVDADGTIRDVATDATPGDCRRLAGPVVPGMPDLHGHAFQRAMAGLAETRGGADDSFWTWREAMYQLVGRLTPDLMHAIAAWLYVELLRGGFTAVAEFHYLHHTTDGTPHADPAEMSVQVIEAARRAGIAITHLPVLYCRGGFDDAPLRGGQVRFRNDPEALADIAERLRARYRGTPDVRIGMALHSLRAVAPADLARAVALTRAADATAPIHIHVAEQTAEVDDCMLATGQRPVAWLLDHVPVDVRWCLVHATHLDAGETAMLARSRAVAGLCPTTEADLGDGVFDLIPFWDQGGQLGVGTDSHVGRSAPDELRWLEYGQRLVRRRRNIAADAAPSVGGSLWRRAATGGAVACGRAAGVIAVGRRADLVVLDPREHDLIGLEGDALLDAVVFSAGQAAIRDVFVGGRHVIHEGHHPDEAAIGEGFAAALRTLRGA